jgi:hypothetical protein
MRWAGHVARELHIKYYFQKILKKEDTWGTYIWKGEYI